MKHILLSVALLFTGVFMQAQERKFISHYVFPEFVKGTVLMKNGARNEALLNYNSASEEMLFDKNGQVLAFSDATVNQVDTVFIAGKKFILMDGKFKEILHDSGYGLFAEHKCRVIPPGKPAAYGGTSQTSSSESYSSWSSDGRVYKLQLPDDFKVLPYTVYWLRKGGELRSFTSIKQVQKFYRSKKNRFKEYTDNNKVDFNDAESFARLIDFMETK